MNESCTFSPHVGGGHMFGVEYASVRTWILYGLYCGSRESENVHMVNVTATLMLIFTVSQ